MGCRLTKSIVLFAVALACAPAYSKTFYLTVAGLGGEPDYEQRFNALASESDKALRSPAAEVSVNTLQGANATKSNIRSSFEQIARQASPNDSLVVLLIGHGNFDGTDYKFNIPGADLSAKELSDLLDRVPATRQLIVDSTSSSGAILKPLTHPGRILVTATRDGAERNATVFARFWVEALHDAAADVDKTDTVTALEAFNYAQRKTASFYEEQKRIATEHAVLSDSQRAGTFALVRFGSAAAAAADPAKKQLMARRDQIEARIDSLKQQKNVLAPEDYKKQLTAMLLELARTQGEIDK